LGLILIGKSSILSIQMLKNEQKLNVIFRIFGLNLRENWKIILSVEIKVAIWRPEKFKVKWH
jgi:hypothetical protein